MLRALVLPQRNNTIMHYWQSKKYVDLQTDLSVRPLKLWNSLPWPLDRVDLQKNKYLMLILNITECLTFPFPAFPLRFILLGKPLNTNLFCSSCCSYTPWVAIKLGDDYQVQHAPWDTRDGGAQDSNYGLQCLRLFLQTAMLEPTRYDVIIFNFGFHDITCNDSWPWSGECTTPVDYAKNLKAIKSILLSTGAQVGYVLTTPVPWNTTLNDRVNQYNNIARDVMKEYPTVATADLYTWVIRVCGDPPYFSCTITDKQPSPHYTAQGYHYLSGRVKDLIADLTQERDVNPRFRERGGSLVRILLF